jgi:hypothetical protein
MHALTRSLYGLCGDPYRLEVVGSVAHVDPLERHHVGEEVRHKGGGVLRPRRGVGSWRSVLTGNHRSDPVAKVACVARLHLIVITQQQQPQQQQQQQAVSTNAFVW